MNQQTDAAGRPPLPPGEFFGHPASLWQLSNIEMWERFAYYGMRALLAVYVATTFFGHLGDQANAEASLVYGGYTALVYATGIIGGYIADKVLGYQRSILLGALVMAAGLFMLLIEDLTWFLIGLAVIVAGNGLFKPNISTMIGKLYAPGDVRRDSGFTVFYMGINLGAFIAPFITAAWIGASYGLKWGFFAAALGMVLSTLFLEIAKKRLGKVGRPDPDKEGWGRFFIVLAGTMAAVPVIYFLLSESAILGVLMINIMFGLIMYFFAHDWGKAGIGIGVSFVVWLATQLYLYTAQGSAMGSEGAAALYEFLKLSAFAPLPWILWAIPLVGFGAFYLVKQLATGDRVQTHRYIAMCILFVANACFWALFEQAGSSMNFFAREHTTPMYGSMDTWQAGGFGIFQSLNPLYILLFAPLFAMLWPALEKKGINPSIPRKFALGLIQVALGFYILVFAVNHMQNALGLVPWFLLALCYLLHTTGELCLSPIGLSMVTKLAAEKETGMAMGGWFLSIAMAQYVAGLFAAIASGGGVDAHGAPTNGNIAQYGETYMLLFWIGLGFGVAYLLVAPLINKLMHGVK